MISERELDVRLRSLAAVVDWPETADVAPAVARATQRQGVRRRVTPLYLRPALAVLAALLVVFTAVLAVSPGARTAVARLLGFPGIAVEVTTEPAPNLSGIYPGEEITLDQAQQHAGWQLGTLPLTAQRVSLDEETGAVHITYRLDDGRAAQLTQLRGAEEIAYLKQSTEVLPTEVDGEFAIWAYGPEHALLRVGGDVIEARQSSNALLWASAGVTYRLEIDAELPEAVRLAETLR